MKGSLFNSFSFENNCSAEATVMGIVGHTFNDIIISGYNSERLLLTVFNIFTSSNKSILSRYFSNATCISL